MDIIESQKKFSMAKLCHKPRFSRHWPNAFSDSKGGHFEKGGDCATVARKHIETTHMTALSECHKGCRTMKSNEFSNMKRLFSLFAFIVVFASIAAGGFAQSLEKAQMFLRFNLGNEGKIELINVVFSNAKADDKAEALYLLGTIAFSENKISQAIDTWKELIAKYPNSSHGKVVQEEIKELSQVVTEVADASVNNAIAQLYLSHGDFWSKGKNNKFVIDASWIPNVEIAIRWYDKVISEFPKSEAARRAYRDKMRTLLGWKELGTRGEKYGIEQSFDTYILMLLETFEAFENSFPEDSLLQPFRYQIAQAYWGNKKWAQTRKWLILIIVKSGAADSFYKDLAEWRLKKIEY